MSHVREGELHAYLDGALDRLGSEVAGRVRLHLASCEDCQSRVEQERDLREEASALLDRAMPREIVPPPFEELLRRAAVGGESDVDSSDPAPSAGTSTGGRTFPAYKWAWAASLVLALGTGWAMGGGSLSFRDLPAAPLAEAAEFGDRDEAATPAEGTTLGPRDNVAAEAAENESAASPAEVDAVQSETGARSATVSRRQAGQPAAAAPRQESPPTPVPDGRSLGEAREKVVASDDQEPRRDNTPAAAPAALASEAQRAADPQLEESADALEDLAGPRATDGQPLYLVDRPILAVVANPNGGASGVLQQLPNGDSVMFVWSGDAVADRELARLGASTVTDSLPAASLSQPTGVRRMRLADAQGGLAPVASFGRADPWPTVVRLSRGAALLTVFGTGDESALRTLLEAAGLTPPES